MTMNAWSSPHRHSHDKGELQRYLRSERAAVARQLRDKRKLAAELGAEIQLLQTRLDQIDDGLDLL